MAKITLKQYLDSTASPDDLKELIQLIAAQGPAIRDAFITNQKYADTQNVYGETQMKLDIWSNEHLKKILKKSGLVKQLASEEEAEVLTFPDAKSNYAVTMDPLDGSSLIQVNLAVGTIIGIYDNGKVMQPGKNMRAAMYILYGPLTTLTVTVKEGIYMFALNDRNEFTMTEQNVKIGDKKLYGTGALQKEWVPKHKKFINEIVKDGFKLRYSGSFVADVHQFLKYGGVFSYPLYKGHMGGKLRLLFEANPLGFIVTQAGGKVSTGEKNILTIMPEKVDHRVPIYIGTKKYVELAEKIIKG